MLRLLLLLTYSALYNPPTHASPSSNASTTTFFDEAEELPLLARSRRTFDGGPDAFYAPGGLNEDGKARAPLVFQLTHNLTQANGPRGRCGVCARTYRVLKDIRQKPNMECQLYYDSRQAALGDLTEFYHALFRSGKQKESITFMLSDSFIDFYLSASLMKPVSGTPPFMMIEVAKETNQALCVQSHRCPELVTTTSTTTTTTTTTTPKPVVMPIVTPFNPIGHTSMTEARSGPRPPPTFWDAVMANSSPRVWVIATVVLAGVCIVLLLALIFSCVWICRAKRRFRLKRCRGTCRFGCKCSVDAIRQANVDAAVCGPLGPPCNGSVLTYPSVGRNWDQKTPFNPIYVSMGANGKLIDTPGIGTPPAQSIYPPAMLGNWAPFAKAGSAKENMWRSHSDGSSLSDHTVPSGVGSGPTAMRSPPSRSSGQHGNMFGFNANPSSATASTCMHSYGGGGGISAGQSGDPALSEGHPGSPVRFDDAAQNGVEHNGITTQPVDVRGLNGGMFDHHLGDMGDTFAQHSEVTSITPPAGFYDGQNQSKLDTSWGVGGVQPISSTFLPTYNQPSFAGGIKVLPTDLLTGTKTTYSPADMKRRNGYLNGPSTSRILSHPLTEGVEQSYSHDGSSDTPLRAWTDALAD